MAERIEVLRGPGSSLYGADAVGGVVQIVTPRGGPDDRFVARAALGGYGSGEWSAGLRGASGMLDLAAALSSERSDGVSALRPGDAFGNYNPDADGYRLDTAQLRLGLTPAAGHRIGLALLRTRLESQYDGSEFLPPDYVQDASADFRSQVDTEVTALDWRGSLATDLVASGTRLAQRRRFDRRRRREGALPHRARAAGRATRLADRAGGAAGGGTRARRRPGPGQRPTAPTCGVAIPPVCWN